MNVPSENHRPVTARRPRDDISAEVEDGKTVQQTVQHRNHQLPELQIRFMNLVKF